MKFDKKDGASFIFSNIRANIFKDVDGQRYICFTSNGKINPDTSCRLNEFEMSKLIEWLTDK